MSKLRNMTTGQIVADSVDLANGTLSRIVGLLNRGHIDRCEGLWFPRCATIHTIGMREEIDVVFLDDRNRVVRTLCGVPPNRIAVSCPNASSTIELGSGALAAADVLIGDQFRLET